MREESETRTLNTCEMKKFFIKERHDMGCRSHGCSNKHKMSTLDFICLVSVLHGCMLLFISIFSLVTPDPIECRECAFTSSLERTAH